MRAKQVTALMMAATLAVTGNGVTAFAEPVANVEAGDAATEALNVETTEEAETPGGISKNTPRYDRSAACSCGNFCSCGNPVEAGSADLRFFHVTDIGSRADCSIGEDQSVKNRRGSCILARK